MFRRSEFAAPCFVRFMGRSPDCKFRKRARSLESAFDIPLLGGPLFLQVFVVMSRCVRV